MSSSNFFNKSKVRFFEGMSLLTLENEINTFMSKQVRIYNVKHQVVIESGTMHYHYVMVSYE